MRILFLTSRFPYPLEKGDKLRAFHQIKELSASHEILLASVSDTRVRPEHLEALKPYCKKIVVYEISKIKTFGNLAKTLFSSRPFQVGYFYSPSFQRRIQKLMKEEKPTHIFCQLVRMAEYVKDVQGVTKVLDYMDAFSTGYERLSARLSLLKRTMVRSEWKRLLKYEHVIFNAFDKQVIISEQDRKLIPHPERNNIFVSPNGVDISYYSQQPMEQKYDLIFSGNMSYPPNVESALFLVNRVMPLLKSQGRQVRIVIAGDNPAPEILKLKNEHVEVTGWVDDMREYYSASRISVAPMFISIGLQNKIIQAMAMNVPCIVSSMANNAIGAEDGKNILIADSPEDYARQITMLLEKPELAASIAREGRQFVQRNFDWREIMADLSRYMQA